MYIMQFTINKGSCDCLQVAKLCWQIFVPNPDKALLSLVLTVSMKSFMQCYFKHFLT